MLTWNETESGITGWAGDYRLFAIERGIGPRWTLACGLPGLISAEWRGDSATWLKDKAEDVLRGWLANVTRNEFTGPAASTAPTMLGVPVAGWADHRYADIPRFGAEEASEPGWEA